MDQHFVTLDYARKTAKPGWLIQVRGKGAFSPWVRLCSGGIHTHSMMVTGPDEISEVREFIGARITDFDFQYNRHKDCLDFFSIRREFYNEEGVYKSVQAMRTIATTAKYDYLNVINLALRRLPGFHLLFDSGTTDDKVLNVSERRYHCSDAVSAALAFGLTDPVPNTPHRLVTPHDLTRSLLFRYEWSI